MVWRGRREWLRATVAVAWVAGVGAFAAPAAGAPGTLRIEGTPGDDQIVIDASATDAGTYTVNGQSQLFAGATKLIVDAGAGNDHVVVNNPTGALLAPTLGIVVNGGDGVDSVTSQNGLAAVGNYTSAFGSTPGRLVQTGAARQVIVANSVENVSDFNSDQKFVFKGTPAHDDMWVDDYPAYPPTTRIILTLPANFIFDGKSSMTVDTLGTDSTPDTVKLTGHAPPFSELAVDDGTQPAEDVITAQDFRFGEAGSSTTLRLHGSRIEGIPNSAANPDITAGSVALDGGTIGTADAPLAVDAAKLDTQAQGDVRVNIKGRLMSSDVQLGGVRNAIGGGVRSMNGSVWLNHVESGPLTSLAQDASVSGQSVYLRSGRLDVSKGHVDAGAGGVTLQSNDGWPIDLGATGDDYGSFNLSAAEIANVRAASLTIGHPNSGLVTATDAIARRSTDALQLVSGIGFTATGPGTITAGELGLTDGSATGRSWSVDSSGVSVDGRAPLPYGSTPKLALNGGSAADAFAVRPSALTMYSIDGGDPSTSPGDSLAYDAGGRAVSGDASPPDGEINATGVKPVRFSRIEDVSIVNNAP